MTNTSLDELNGNGPDGGLPAEGGVKWQPIETAPKDGTWIIAWCVHQNSQWSKAPVGEGWEAPVLAQWIDHNGGGWTWNGLCGQFTHWMPLPKAPVTS